MQTNSTRASNIVQYSMTQLHKKLLAHVAEEESGGKSSGSLVAVKISSIVNNTLTIFLV